MPPRSPADTIAAIATPPAGALRAILRVSGGNVVACLRRCCGFAAEARLESIRRPTVLTGWLALLDEHAHLPCDVYLWPGHRSYTREPMAELHTIGSPPLLEAAMRAICAAGARLAYPGEFTLRAFMAGRLDLPRAEAVLGVIDAASQRELHVALGQLAGGVSEPLNQLRDRLLDLLADLEAGLDFAEEDIEFIKPESLGRQLQEAERAVGGLLAQMSARTTSVGIPRVVLYGSPNVGKSSLLNALVSQSAALVADMPGTTRDYLVKRADLDGLTCELVDTAGVAPANDQTSAAAGRMTRRQHEQAQLELFCLDATRPLNAWERSRLEASGGPCRLVVLTKMDAGQRTDFNRAAIETSSHTGQGLWQLRQAIVENLSQSPSGESNVVAETATRCRGQLQAAQASLERARKLAVSRRGDELVAAEVRAALDQLGSVVGAVYTEDLLERIFSRFCIGK